MITNGVIKMKPEPIERYLLIIDNEIVGKSPCLDIILNQVVFHMDVLREKPDVERVEILTFESFRNYREGTQLIIRLIVERNNGD